MHLTISAARPSTPVTLSELIFCEAFLTLHQQSVAKVPALVLPFLNFPFPIETPHLADAGSVLAKRPSVHHYRSVLSFTFFTHCLPMSSIYSVMLSKIF